MSEKEEQTTSSWADWDDDDQELPPLPSEWDAYGTSPCENKSKQIIKFTPEYIYKNS